MQTTLIINPKADQGRCNAKLPQISQTLNDLSLPFETKQTEAPRHGIKLAQQAAVQGSACVVAVGGDGTVNEVVNGLMLVATAGHYAKLGLIPVGSGNDFAYAVGVPPNIIEACAILKQGIVHKVDIGKVTVDGVCRYFDNSAIQVIAPD